jgi:hypothetical protein
VPSGLLHKLAKRNSSLLASSLLRACGSPGDAAALAHQRRPTLVTVNQDTPLVEHLKNKQGCALASGTESRHIYTATHRTLKPHRKTTGRTGQFIAKLDEHVNVRVATLITAGHRAVQDRKPDIGLGT